MCVYIFGLGKNHGRTYTKMLAMKIVGGKNYRLFFSSFVSIFSKRIYFFFFLKVDWKERDMLLLSLNSGDLFDMFVCFSSCISLRGTALLGT